MLSNFLNWIKNNKLAFVLLLVVLYFLSQKYWQNPPIMPFNQQATDTMMSIEPQLREKMGVGGYSPSNMPSSFGEAAPAPDVANRLVQQESYLSLQVKNVREAQDQVVKTAESLGGYMVNTNLNNPQDAPTSTITVRVPSKSLNETLNNFRELAVKVVSENLSGQDVTDQYVDNEARLKTLENTKAKFQSIFDQATKIEDILRVQQELINIQSQIDALKGQQNYLEKNAEMARLTVYLSTDEYALPYTPSDTWRPEVIFKQAVRSLVANFRKLGTALIWLVVYSVILIPVLLLIRYFLKKK